MQPHGRGLSYFALVFDHYRALRRAGLSVDILPPGARDFAGYHAVFAPGLIHMTADLKSALAASGCAVLIGPRSGARDAHFAIPVPLPPAFPGLDVTVSRVESLRPDMPVPVPGGGAVTRYREALETALEPLLSDATGAPVAVREGRITYVGGWGDEPLIDRIIADICGRVGLATMTLPRGVRIRDTRSERFWFNYNPHAVETPAGVIPAAGMLRTSRSERPARIKTG